MALALLAACSRVPGLDSGAEGYARGFAGAVAADEPQAVLVARDVLATGGSAADAVVAAYFTMSVTLPSAASLGAGGVCLIHDKAGARAEALDFTHPTSGPFAGRAVPIAPRAMHALHARYGNRPWTQLLGAAESAARLGISASRALARDLSRVGGTLTDPVLTQIFADKLGNPVAESGRVQQVALAATLSGLRRQPTQFYVGPQARRIADAYSQAGVPLTAEDMRAILPRFRPVITVARRNQVAHFPPTAAGAVTAQAWALLHVEGLYSQARGPRAPHVLAEVSRRAFADAGRWFAAPGGVPDQADGFVAPDRIRRLVAGFNPDRAGGVPALEAGLASIEPADRGSASIVATDVFGLSVACGFTMNGIMGAGRIAPETGIVVAAPPDAARKGAPALGLMILRNGTQQQLEFMGAATGGAAVPLTLATMAAKTLDGDLSAERMLAAARLYHPAQPDRVVVEDGAEGAQLAARLRAAGHQVVTAPSLGRANILICPRGFDGERSQCDVRADRRAFGLAQQN